MTENYNVQAIIDDLKQKGEMDAEKHDGCYELLRETVEAYANLNDLSTLDYRDLNLVYLTTVGTWSQGIDAKKKMVSESNLSSKDKKYLTMLWNDVWERAGRGEYMNYEASAQEGQSIGLFGTGFLSFKRKDSEPTSEQVQSFIRMLIELLPMEDDDEMFSRAEEVLRAPIPGMQAAAASMILHCLKPYTFPILNANTGSGNIFEVLGVSLTKTSSLENYIDNCRKIKAFRDENFACKNYRIFDIEAQNMENFAVIDSRVWLLAWNKNNWYWENYSDKCVKTKNGQSVRESWSCSSTKPKRGDEVFLIKLGEQPRCLIGHGHVVRESYESDHYGDVKSSEGKKIHYIDVDFDRLLDYEKEECVPQDELAAKCSAQHWSPQSSGIEIKPEVLPTLYALWGAVTRGKGEYDFAGIVSFLSDYSGEHYIVPDKAGDQAEYMTELKTRGQEAYQNFKAFGQKIAEKIPPLEYISCSSWINQGQTVEQYLWIQLKNNEWKDYPHSVSLSVEKHDEVYPGEGYYLSIRAEVQDVDSKESDYERQMRLLDCEILDGMTYRVKLKDQSYHFYGTDTETVRALCDDDNIQKVEIIEAIENLPEKDSEGTLFNETLKAVKEILPLYEHVMKEEDWWPSLTEYDPGISAEQYHDLFLDERVVERDWLQALYEMYQMPNHLGTCKQMGDKYGHKAGHYISYMSTVASKIAKETNCPVLPREEKNSNYWPILFQGKHIKDKTQGTYCWKMRVPVIEAMGRIIAEGTFEIEEKTQTAQFSRNTILYGPPGTGKTYNSVIYAVAICDGKSLDDVKNVPYKDVLQRYNELCNDDRIAFITFHQSYSYEEFIEGIRPKLGMDSESLEYTIEDGVFKAFCNRARTVKVNSTTNAQIKAEPRIWGMILGGSGMTALKKQCFENNEIRLGWSEVDDDDVDGDFVADDKISWNAKHMVSDFKNSMEVGDLVVIEKSSKSIDAIGVITGEYLYDKSQGRYPRSRAVEWLVKDIDQDILQFLPNDRKRLSRFSVFAFDYIGMDVISQILHEYLNDSMIKVEQETRPYIFIIDEINRGNISKIFGELITLIEDKKRAGASEEMNVILPYSQELFSIPKNVYIIGTMNTADRSIALIDTALRRRFDFVEMMPDSKVLENIKLTIEDKELNVAKMLDVINERIKYLFDREHTIGHALFIKLENSPSLETLAEIFEKNVIPLLQEYFYDDYEKIQLVLGDNAKEDEFKFILDYPVKVKDVFNGNPDIDLPEKGYVIQHSAFGKLESYKKIGKDL